MKSQRKLGGQNKVPRLSNDGEIAEVGDILIYRIPLRLQCLR